METKEKVTEKLKAIAFKIIESLDDYARDYDSNEYGLPMHIDQYIEAMQEIVIDIIQPNFIDSIPSQSGEAVKQGEGWISEAVENIYRFALEKWGKETQIKKIQEEALELALALNQYYCPTKDKPKIFYNLIGELADMKIMMIQAELIFGKENINQRVVEKLKSFSDKYLTNSQTP